jgi:hypothetical protein
VSARTIIAIRAVVAVWLLALTVVLLVYGRWGWAILTGTGILANAAWAVYIVRRRGCNSRWGNPPVFTQQARSFGCFSSMIILPSKRLRLCLREWANTVPECVAVTVNETPSGRQIVRRPYVNRPLGLVSR